MTGTRRSSCLVKVGNAELYGETYGKGAPFIMLHAGVADSRQWNNEFEFFSETHRVIRYDMRGYGRSEPVEGEFTHLRDLVAVLDYLEVQEPAVIMGCSMGAQLAVDLALEHPARVKALVLLGAGVTGLEYNVPELPKHAEAEQAWKDGDIERTAEIETQIWFDGTARAAQQVDQGMRRLAFEMDKQALSFEARKLGTPLPNTSTPACKRLSQIKVPALIIVGAQDEPFVNAASDYMLKHMPNARRAVMQDAAHLANMDHPTVFRGLVKDFLSRLPA
jgi:pimeloyl-ACP methyl ester carboxylesterase